MDTIIFYNKSIATVKRISTNRSYAIGDFYACKTVATIKRRIGNTNSVISENSGSYIRITANNPFVNIMYTIIFYDKSVATVKRISTDRSDAVSNSYTYQLIVVIKSILINRIRVTVAVFRKSYFCLITFISYEITNITVFIEYKSVFCFKGLLFSFGIRIYVKRIEAYISVIISSLKYIIFRI